jgi:hypothetical protein
VLLVLQVFKKIYAPIDEKKKKNAETESSVIITVTVRHETRQLAVL